MGIHWFDLTWAIAFSLFVSYILYCCRYISIYFGRDRHQITTKGKVIRLWKVELDGRPRYNIQCEFEDRRTEISTQYTPLLIEQWLLKNNYIFPTDIINICNQYLGHPFIFWFGPFRKNEEVTRLHYRCYSIGNSYTITYDPKYPEHSSIPFYRDAVIRTGCAFVSALPILMLIFYFEFPFDNKWNGGIGTLMIIISITLIVTIVMSVWYYKVEKIKQAKRIKKLNVERLDQDREESIHDKRTRKRNSYNEGQNGRKSKFVSNLDDQGQYVTNAQYQRRQIDRQHNDASEEQSSAEDESSEDEESSHDNRYKKRNRYVERRKERKSKFVTNFDDQV